MDLEQTTYNLYNALHHQIEAQMPRFVGYAEPHPYATGNMHSHFVTRKLGNAQWSIELSPNVEYSGQAMGYDENYNKLTPRGQHEVRNFQILERVIRQVTKQYATIGTVVINL